MTSQDITLTVTIGRNVGDEPMDRETWDRAQDALRDWANYHLREVYFSGAGRGYSPQWGVEDAFTIVGDWGSYGNWVEAQRDLETIAEDYGQEAVAVTRGTTAFVG